MTTPPAFPAQEPQGPPSDGLLSEKEILEKYSGELNHLLAGQVLGSIDQEKTWHYLTLRRNHAYYKGHHATAPTISDGFADFRSVSSSSNWAVATDDSYDAPYDYVINVYKGDLRKFSAVLGQRAPNVHAGPRTENNQHQVDRSRKAQLAGDFLHQVWDANKLQRKLAFSLGIAGTSFGYVSYVTDSDKYGSTEEPLLESTDIMISEASYECPGCQAMGKPGVGLAEEMPTEGVCPDCGAQADMVEPVTESIAIETGQTETYANGGVELRILNGLFVTTPFYTRDLKECPWLLYQYEEDYGKLLQSYPSLRDGDLESLSWITTDTMGKTARQQIGSLSGTSYTWSNDRRLFSRFWLRPSMFEYVADDNLRNSLKAQYPSGIKVTTVDGFLVQVESESMDEVWVECQPEENEYLWREGYLDDMIQCADLMDDFWNIVIETVERSIPMNIVDPRVIDIEQIRQKGRNVAEMIPARQGYSGDFRQAVHQIKAAEADGNIAQFAAGLLEIYREITGITPPIFGGGAYETAHEAELNRSQALMMLSTPYNNMRGFWEKITELGCRQLSKYSAGTLYRPNGKPEDALEIEGIEELDQGGYVFTSEESYPMTPGQVKDQIVELLLANNPEVPRKLGLYNPTNMPSIEAAMGLPGWELPDATARKRLLAIIDELLQSQPQQIMGPMGPMEVPSKPPNHIMFDPTFALEVIRQWMASPEGEAAEKTNEIGFLNVLLYALEYEKMMAPLPVEGEEAPVEGGGEGAPAPSEGVPVEPSTPGLESPPPETMDAAPVM